MCVAAGCVWTDARVVCCVTDLWPAPGQSSAPDLIGWEVCRAGAVSEEAGLESDEEETNKQTVDVCLHRRSQVFCESVLCLMCETCFQCDSRLNLQLCVCVCVLPSAGLCRTLQDCAVC